MDGCWILNKLWRRRVKRCQRVTATLRHQLSKCEHYYHFFPPAHSNFAPHSPHNYLGYGKWLNQKYGLRKASRSVFGQKSVGNTCLTKYSDLCSVCTTGVHFFPEQTEGPVACESQLCAMTQASLPIQFVYQQSTPRGHADDVCSVESVMCQHKMSWFESSLWITVHPHPRFNCFSDQITGWHWLYFGSRIQTARYKQQMDCR